MLAWRPKVVTAVPYTDMFLGMLMKEIAESAGGQLLGDRGRA